MPAPSRPVAELELLGEEEIEQLRQWSAGGEVSTGPSIEQLIEEQAAVRPEAVAVVCEGEQLTYWAAERADEPAGPVPAASGESEPRCWSACAWSGHWTR